MKKVILLLILLGMIILGTFAVRPIINSVRINRIKENNGKAYRALLTLRQAIEDFRRKEYSKQGKTYPCGYGDSKNAGKFCALYYEIDESGKRISLIPENLANADLRARKDMSNLECTTGVYVPSLLKNGELSYQDAVEFELKPYFGYWFMLLEGYDGPPGESFNYDVENAKSHFGIIAIPAKKGITGDLLLIMKEDGMIFYKTDFKKSIDRYPGDPIQHGWYVNK